jgi:hypothetical protein
MPRYIVTLTTSASTVVEVTAPDGATRDQVADMAVAQLEAEGAPELCVACDHHVELGDDWQVPGYGSASAVTPLPTNPTI